MFFTRPSAPSMKHRGIMYHLWIRILILVASYGKRACHYPSHTFARVLSAWGSRLGAKCVLTTIVAMGVLSRLSQRDSSLLRRNPWNGLIRLHSLPIQIPSPPPASISVLPRITKMLSLALSARRVLLIGIQQTTRLPYTSRNARLVLGPSSNVQLTFLIAKGGKLSFWFPQWTVISSSDLESPLKLLVFLPLMRWKRRALRRLLLEGNHAGLTTVAIRDLALN